MIEFRPLKAGEVETRVSMVKETGVQLLLFKDARCDMRLLDEVVGPENWENEYKEIGGSLYCGVTVRVDGIPVTKWNNGSESNTEAEKGRASDAFKRACFMWGIGRELYTAPFIWVPASKCEISQGRNGRPQCRTRFVVAHMAVDDSKRISALIIKNARTGADVFEFGAQKAPERPRAINPSDQAPENSVNLLMAKCRQLAELRGVPVETVIAALNESQALKAEGYSGGAYTASQCQAALNQAYAWLRKYETKGNNEGN